MTRYQRYLFFKENAGWSAPPGRAACALQLAQAEELLEQAEELGLASVRWEDDWQPYDPGDVCTEEQARERFESGEWSGPFGCVVKVLPEQELASLWGIVVGSRGTDDPYCRVVAAELACELEDELRQAIGDARDARMEVCS